MQGVLDASAVLALIYREPGHDTVAAALASGSQLSAVNLAEVATRCTRGGMPPDVTRRLVALLPVTLVGFDADLAHRAGEMINITRPFGLSLGDRCCLALAAREGVPAISADRSWLDAAPLLGVTVTVIR